jgi:hypothetical protein
MIYLKITAYLPIETYFSPARVTRTLTGLGAWPFLAIANEFGRESCTNLRKNVEAVLF